MKTRENYSWISRCLTRRERSKKESICARNLERGKQQAPAKLREHTSDNLVGFISTKELKGKSRNWEEILDANLKELFHETLNGIWRCCASIRVCVKVALEKCIGWTQNHALDGCDKHSSAPAESAGTHKNCTRSNESSKNHPIRQVRIGESGSTSAKNG